MWVRVWVGLTIVIMHEQKKGQGTRIGAMCNNEAMGAHSHGQFSLRLMIDDEKIH